MNKILKELNVLYADDDKNACDSLKHILKYYFKNVSIAHNGLEALDCYFKSQYHLLIVDYDMPLMNGYEFLKKIRELDDDISAVILSSYDDKIKLKNAIKLNLLDYITKPYELSELENIFKEFAIVVTKKGLLKNEITANCHYDSTKKIIIKDNVEQKLTSYETITFEYLLKHRGKTIKYDEFLFELDSNNFKSLQAIIHKIKKKLPDNLIENIKDIGYRLK